jgi:hypothetical protein
MYSFVRKYVINIQVQILQRRYIYSIKAFQNGNGTILKNKIGEVPKVAKKLST